MEADMTLKTQNTHHTVCPNVFVVLGVFFYLTMNTKHPTHSEPAGTQESLQAV